MKNQREITCLGCPNGCALSVAWTGADDIEVVGAKCDRGRDYAIAEILEPKRTVTAVVRTGARGHPCVPVKTDKPLRMELIPELLREVYARTVALPVARGGVFIENFAGSGVNVVFTRTVD